MPRASVSSRTRTDIEEEKTIFTRPLYLRCLASSVLSTHYSVLLNGLGIHGRTHSASNRQRRRRKHKLVDAVFCAVFGEFLKIEDFTHQHTGMDNQNNMQWLKNISRFVRNDFGTPGVGCIARDLLFAEP